MTDDEFTIHDPMQELLDEIERRVEEGIRKGNGVDAEFRLVSTIGACVELINVGRRLIDEIFTMKLPGIPLNEQRDLAERHKALLRERKKQIKRSAEYAKKTFEVRRKEADE